MVPDQKPTPRYSPPPRNWWRAVPCNHPPDPVAWWIAPDGPTCHCGQILDPTDGHDDPASAAPGTIVQCGECGCHVAIPPKPAPSPSLPDSGERARRWLLGGDESHGPDPECLPTCVNEIRSGPTLQPGEEVWVSEAGPDAAELLRGDQRFTVRGDVLRVLSGTGSMAEIVGRADRILEAVAAFIEGSTAPSSGSGEREGLEARRLIEARPTEAYSASDATANDYEAMLEYANALEDHLRAGLGEPVPSSPPADGEADGARLEFARGLREGWDRALAAVEANRAREAAGGEGDDEPLGPVDRLLVGVGALDEQLVAYDRAGRTRAAELRPDVLDAARSVVALAHRVDPQPPISSTGEGERLTCPGCASGIPWPFVPHPKVAEGGKLAACPQCGARWQWIVADGRTVLDVAERCRFCEGPRSEPRTILSAGSAFMCGDAWHDAAVAGERDAPAREDDALDETEWRGPWWAVRMATGDAWAWTESDALALVIEAAGGQVRAFVPASSVPACEDGGDDGDR